LFSWQLRKRHPQDSLGDERLFKKKLDNIEAVRDIVHKIASPLKNRQLEMKCIGSIYSMPFSMDDAIAIILCMATNLEYVELAISHTMSTEPTLTRHLLGQRWADVVDPGTTFPFCKLKTLWENNGSALILPTMEAIILHNVNRASSPCYFRTPYAEIGLGTRLQVSVFGEVDFDTAGLEGLIATQELRNLKELRFRGIGDNAADSLWASYDFSRLSRALVAYIPKLHVFEWSRYKFDPSLRHCHPFSTFVGLNNLKSCQSDGWQGNHFTHLAAKWLLHIQ
jgi:hypothetical protein